MPTKEEAWQFALMTQAGMPALAALQYFLAADTPPGDVALILKQWANSTTYRAALLKLQGKTWQEMTLDERIQTAIDLHYNQLAYILYSRNYAELVGAERQKADICRAALEAKIAGTSGKMGPLEQFWADIRSGKVKLAGLPA